MPQVSPIADAKPKDATPLVLTLGATIAALYFGSEIFVPIALAILLSFALAPGVRLLQHWHLGRVLPVLLMTILAFCVIFALAGVMAMQVRDLAADAPRFEATIKRKVETLRGLAAHAGLQRAMDTVSNMSQALHQDRTAMQSAKSVAVEPQGSGQPMAVAIEPPTPTPLETLSRILSPLLHPIATLGIVVVFIMFILLQREDLRNRLIRLVGAGDLHRSTAAIDDAARRLSRYLLTQLGLNTAAGLTVGAALWLLGVPSPILWGILFGSLRFVPYVGPPLATILPVALAAAVDPGWTLALSTLATFVVVEAVVGQVLEPFLYGHNTGLSPVAIVIAATFWTALWGPIGLILATPMTVCLVVLGRHVEQLAFLDVLLGDRPPLSMSETFYQRMLANDPVEASDQAETCLRTMDLVEYYDTVVFAALRLAQDDVAQGRLDIERQRRIAACVDEVVDDLAEEDIGRAPKAHGLVRPQALLDRFTHRQSAPGETVSAATAGGATPVPAEESAIAERAAEEATTAPAAQGSAPQAPAPTSPPTPPAWREPAAVLCLGARGPLDDAAARILAQVLAKHGFGATAASYEMLLKSNLGRLDLAATQLICLSCLDGASATYLRFLVRRLRRRSSSARILVGAWWRGGEDRPAEPQDDMINEPAATTVGEAVAYCEGQALEQPRRSDPVAAPAALAAVS